MSDHTPTIRQLFALRLRARAQQRNWPLQLENEVFTPPNTGRAEDRVYLQAFLLPATTTSDTLDGDDRNYAGVYQINIVAPSGIGPGLAGRIAQELASLFPNNLVLTAEDGFKVQQVTPLRVRAGIPGASAFTLPTDFGYRNTA